MWQWVWTPQYDKNRTWNNDSGISVPVLIEETNVLHYSERKHYLLKYSILLGHDMVWAWLVWALLCLHQFCFGRTTEGEQLKCKILSQFCTRQALPYPTPYPISRTRYPTWTTEKRTLDLDVAPATPTEIPTVDCYVYWYDFWCRQNGCQKLHCKILLFRVSLCDAN